MRVRGCHEARWCYDDCSQLICHYHYLPPCIFSISFHEQCSHIYTLFVFHRSTSVNIASHDSLLSLLLSVLPIPHDYSHLDGSCNFPPSPPYTSGLWYFCHPSFPLRLHSPRPGSNAKLPAPDDIQVRRITMNQLNVVTGACPGCRGWRRQKR